MALLERARQQVDEAKIALGERGKPWWTDGAPDWNRHMVREHALCRVVQCTGGWLSDGRDLRPDRLQQLLTRQHPAVEFTMDSIALQVSLDEIFGNRAEADYG